MLNIEPLTRFKWFYIPLSGWHHLITLIKLFITHIAFSIAYIRTRYFLWNLFFFFVFIFKFINLYLRFWMIFDNRRRLNNSRFLWCSSSKVHKIFPYISRWVSRFSKPRYLKLVWISIWILSLPWSIHDNTIECHLLYRSTVLAL